MAQAHGSHFEKYETKLANDSVIEGKIAPSYYLEGLLYNVPDDKLTTDYEECFVNAINWIQKMRIRANCCVPTSSLICCRTTHQPLGRKLIGNPPNRSH